SYDITEGDPRPNFEVGAIVCDDDDSSADVATRTAHVVLDPAETVTCTFTNVDQRGHIVITKAVDPPGAGDQQFGFTTPCGFPLLEEGGSFDCRTPAGSHGITRGGPRRRRPAVRLHHALRLPPPRGGRELRLPHPGRLLRHHRGRPPAELRGGRG